MRLSKRIPGMLVHGQHGVELSHAVETLGRIAVCLQRGFVFAFRAGHLPDPKIHISQCGMHERGGWDCLHGFLASLERMVKLPCPQVAAHESNMSGDRGGLFFNDSLEGCLSIRKLSAL